MSQRVKQKRDNNKQHRSRKTYNALWMAQKPSPWEIQGKVLFLFSKAHEIFIIQTWLIWPSRSLRWVSMTQIVRVAREGESASSHFQTIWLCIKNAWDELHSIPGLCWGIHTRVQNRALGKTENKNNFKFPIAETSLEQKRPAKCSIKYDFTEYLKHSVKKLYKLHCYRIWTHYFKKVILCH